MIDVQPKPIRGCRWISTLLFATVFPSMVACWGQSDEPCIGGMVANQNIEISLAAEYDADSGYVYEATHTPMMRSCLEADGLASGMALRARTTREPIQGKACQYFHLEEVVASLGPVTHDGQLCAPLDWMGISANCGRVEIDGCPWLIGYMIDHPYGDRRTSIGEPLEESGYPLNRFSRVLVPDPWSDVCPSLADDPGCADTWVVTLREM